MEHREGLKYPLQAIMVLNIILEGATHMEKQGGAKATGQRRSLFLFRSTRNRPGIALDGLLFQRPIKSVPEVLCDWKIHTFIYTTSIY